MWRAAPNAATLTRASVDRWSGRDDLRRNEEAVRSQASGSTADERERGLGGGIRQPLGRSALGRAPRDLVDDLFTPGQMEHKWALFVRQGQLIIVRSWRRKVFARVDFEHDGDCVVLRALRGTLLGDGEPADLSERTVDFILRSHVLKLPYPAPLPPGMSEAPETAALWCMNTYGNLASFATEEPFARVEPTKPLRSHSLLHINVARGDTAAIQRCLQQGIPIDLLAGDGLAPLHWSLAEESGKALQLLLASGCPVDVRSDEGSTALMLAVQGRRLEQTRLLLDRGADANAADARGFTSLHRAAEMGQLEIAQLLISHGASPDAAAGEHTPLSLALARGEKAMEALLASSK